MNSETEQIEKRITGITESIAAQISSLFPFLLSLQAQNAVVHHLPTSLSSPFQSFHPMLLPSTLLFSHRVLPAWVYQAARQQKADSSIKKKKKRLRKEAMISVHKPPNTSSPQHCLHTLHFALPRSKDGARLALRLLQVLCESLA